MVDIIDVALGVDKFNKIFDNGDDILTGKHLHIHRSVEFQLLVDSVTSHLAEVVTLLREEEVLDHLTCRLLIRRLGVAKLAIDILHSLDLRICGVFLKSVEDDAVIDSTHILTLKKNSLHTRLKDGIDVILSDFVATIHNKCVTLDRDNLTGVLIHEILLIRIHHTACKLAADGILEIGFGNFYFVSKVKNLNDILV